ncbi:MAG UNVERIFIED_CONTAM: WD40 repeat domain-containing protein [Anaerolineae bacterium]|jgi:WD40 repeat protein
MANLRIHDILAGVFWVLAQTSNPSLTLDYVVFTEPLRGKHDLQVNDLAFSRDGMLLASGSNDITTRLWSLEDDSERLRLDGQLSEVRAVAFDATDDQLITGGFTGQAYFWDIQTATRNTRLGYTSPIIDLTVSDDGEWLALGVGDGTVRLFDLEDTSTEVHVLVQDALSVRALAFSPDATLLAVAVGFPADQVVLWERETGTRVATLHTHDQAVNALRFTADGDFLLSASDDRTVDVWQLANNGVIHQWEHAAPVQALDVAPNGWVLSSDDRGGLYLWELTNGILLQTRDFSPHQAITAVEFSHDGQTVALGTRDGTIILGQVNDTTGE